MTDYAILFLSEHADVFASTINKYLVRTASVISPYKLSEWNFHEVSFMYAQSSNGARSYHLPDVIGGS